MVQVRRAAVDRLKEARKRGWLDEHLYLSKLVDGSGYLLIFLNYPATSNKASFTTTPIIDPSNKTV
jgi:GTP-dependent phosphoenolpyruvate carboxykinase